MCRSVLRQFCFRDFVLFTMVYDHSICYDCVKLVSRCFKPCQPQRIISGMKETFRERYIVERTNKAETKTGRTE